MDPAAAPPPRRVRTPDDRDSRARAILEAALSLCESCSFGEVTMSRVAERAGIAKGTVYLYYPGKDALGLALLDHLLAAWFDDLDARLDESGWGSSPREVAQAVASAVHHRAELLRLVSTLGAAFEETTDAELAGRYRSLLLGRLARTGAKLEEILPFLTPGDGARLLLVVYALVMGLHRVAGRAPVAEHLLEAPELRSLRLDFASLVAEAVRFHLEGIRSVRVGAAPPREAAPAPLLQLPAQAPPRRWWGRP